MPRVDRTPPAEQIAEHYRAEIRAGRLRSGDTLPTNRQLAADWEVGTATALRAVTILRTEGWVETRTAKPPVVVGVPDTK